MKNKPFIAPNASVMGNVTFGEDVSVWYGAVIRADVEAIIIGDRSNIQDTAVLHADPGDPTIIGKDVTVGHGAIVHGATVGDGSLIGMRATVLNKAKIGKNCIIGACALVTEGMEVPDNSLVVGIPAKVIKQISEQQAQHLPLSALHYVEMAERHENGEFELIS
ncbi:carbonic anhydrase/acetyltransferase-like protein (isoleucine patch superfamily) [Arcicella aurantiaca]|uniref:Carbonic anhydrase/acetyltransferase-like protein (Isoleucine patch superfamily) n=1 Tax=Arcicella aurantiaca TaxID=591202 RepID=A0A316E3T0_9BACT|nr:gamma carbonic anhydrase family protein [Arcicella aurantiaca]PWK23373.1 carbonic anhydrase/acetyltransferase-like protein (isoleucine patch superfamily) [Arcicella aurantiaca]